MIRFWSSLVLYPIAVAALAWLYPHTLVLAAVFLVLIGAALVIDRRPGDAWIVVGGAVLGPLAEGIAVAFGAWTYAASDTVGLPLWLPPAWGLATLLVKRITEIFGPRPRADTDA